MANSHEIFEQIKELYTQFEKEHNGSTKAAKARARKAIGEIKKLVTDYRKSSIEEGSL
jgi:signal transduction histidine kinase